MNKLVQTAHEVLKNNWQDGYTIPCQGLYPFQWNWDSGFIAIGWAHLDIEKAKQEVQSLLKGQWANGFLPHIVFHKESSSYYPGPNVHQASLSEWSPSVKTSGITQPPVLGFVLEELYHIAPNKKEILDFINQVFQAVYANHQYFYSNRDPQNEALVYICHNWEAGTDNTPVWDFIWDTFTVPKYNLPRKDTQLIDPSHRPTNKEYSYYIHLIELFKSWKYNDDQIAAKSPFLVQDPLFNSMLIASNTSLIRLGKLLSKTKEVTQLEQWNTRAIKSFNTKLWDPNLGGYVYYDLRNDRKLSHLASSSFAPLFAGIPEPWQAKELANHFNEGRFSGMQNERFLCASFDPTSTYFNSKKYWRGPIWINLNWLIFRGLKAYNLSDEAERLKQDSLYFMERYGFYEYFESSKEAHNTLTQGYGGNNFSWSAALTVDLILNQNY